MENQLNPHWYAWMLEQQRKYNIILAFGTIIVAIVGILQIVKIYDFPMPDWIFYILGFTIFFCIMMIMVTLFISPPKN